MFYVPFLCFFVLFANACQKSWSLSLKYHVRFVIKNYVDHWLNYTSELRERV